MLTKTEDVPSAALATPLLSTEEAFHLEALGSALPHDWTLELKADPDMAWVAVIYCVDAPRDRPMFTICWWSDRTGLLMRWTADVISSAVAVTELQQVVGRVLHVVFALSEEYPVELRSENYANNVQ